MSASPLLTARSLCAGYGDFQALFSIDFDIRAGEVVALIGANGAGKSTLLKAFVGLVPIRDGSLDFCRVDVSKTPAHALVSRGLTMVPEGRRLFRGMTVEDNLRVAADHAGKPAAGTRPWTLERLYDLFPVLAERRTQAVEELSGGQQQMVAIGRALMTQPKLLLCDEISLGLAPKVISEIYDMLPIIRQAGTAILLVEQDVSLASRSSDRVYCMLEGRITLTGKSSDVTREQITQAYFGVKHDLG
ncbi:branched-chain amino acid transport system ATP-binding protein [Rhizobium sp. SG_E_25_P2]|uniref:ABC transporter ATP-binding protein n=1 Tax=Rhizobium sp. SG_E_25_P2 TaxID=2879942 RepID=UPI002472EC96|nr:ABC transporter ATP-binding protein [Rhizobium sp. SG_E_25_P2]MDH6266021.1 branched-chain amino acid transport system ATP-binding protein [Rhizobium sp. SG_E_25_P2]